MICPKCDHQCHSTKSIVFAVRDGEEKSHVEYMSESCIRAQKQRNVNWSDCVDIVEDVCTDHSVQNGYRDNWVVVKYGKPMQNVPVPNYECREEWKLQTVRKYRVVVDDTSYKTERCYGCKCKRCVKKAEEEYAEALRYLERRKFEEQSKSWWYCC